MANLRSIQRLTKLFQPISAITKDVHVENKEALSKSQKLLTELGIIRPADHGHFYFLPLGMRILQKLRTIVDKEMENINAQKVSFPSLTNSKLWKRSGRLEDDLSSELFKINDRHKDMYILSPTHEEAAADLLSSINQASYKQFPLRLYQITSKFRDEMKPRFGLIRSREFLMKDLYTFDISLEKAEETYGEVCNSYDRIFEKIGVKFVKVLGSSGNMGGSISHEYHFVAPIGEDKLLSCSKCGYMANMHLTGQEKCLKCGSTNTLSVLNGLEVGHTFLLGDRYSVPLKAYFKSDTDQQVPLQMGSYGLGLSRILASAVEVLSTEHEIRWPNALAPFLLILIPPKVGSKEEKISEKIFDNLSSSLKNIPYLVDNILIDDRTSLTIGRRCLDAKRVGYPFVVVLGTKILQDAPLFELIDVNKNETMFLSVDSVIDFFKTVNLQRKLVNQISC